MTAQDRMSLTFDQDKAVPGDPCGLSRPVQPFGRLLLNLACIAVSAAQIHSILTAQTKLILSSRLALLIVILNSIFAVFECDSQQHILVH